MRPKASSPKENSGGPRARRPVGVGNCAHLFGPHGAAEVIEVVGHDHEGAGPADDVFLVVFVEHEVGRATEVGAVHHHRQAVDHDTLRNQLVAHDLGRRPIVCAPVARHIDDAALGSKAGIVEALAGMGEGGADGRPALRCAWRLGELFGEAPCRTRAVEHRPVDHHGLVMRAGPFGVANRDAAVFTRQNCIDHALVGKRFDVTASLEFGFDFVDRARHVDREHELEIDRRFGPGRRRCGHCRQGAHKRCPSLHARLPPKGGTIAPDGWRQRKTPEEKTSGADFDLLRAVY